MSLDTVAEDIREEARTRAEEIRTEAEREAEEQIAEAEAEAEEIRAEAEREVERQIAQEREQRLSSATLEAKQMRLEARRNVLGDVRERVEDRIAELSGERRERLTRELLDAAAEEFDDDPLEVYARPNDEELVREILTDYDGAEFAGTYDCLGGVVVESEGSRIRVNNTFDSILEDVWDENLKDVSARLFEQ